VLTVQIKNFAHPPLLLPPLNQLTGTIRFTHSFTLASPLPSPLILHLLSSPVLSLLSGEKGQTVPSFESLVLVLVLALV
jgi:hypothetical protein